MVNAFVEVRDNESLSSAISRFKKQCKLSGMYSSMKSYHVGKSEKRRTKKHLAESRKLARMKRQVNYK